MMRRRPPSPPDTALVVLGAECDAFSGGAAPVPGADDIVPLIQQLVPLYDTVVYAQRGPRRGPAGPPPAAAPAPAVAPDDDAEPGPAAEAAALGLHPGLPVFELTILIPLPAHTRAQATSAFVGTELARRLERRGAARLHLCGLGFDTLIRPTAIDALRAGFDVTVLTNACRGVAASEAERLEARDELAAAGVNFLHTSVVLGAAADDDEA